MLKYTCCFYLFILFILTSCAEKDEVIPTDTLLSKVDVLHERIDFPLSETLFQALKRQEKWMLDPVAEVPDSVYANHVFFIGTYYKEKGMADSAAIYFQQALDKVGERIVRDREIDYFQLAWDNYFDQNRIGDCITISERFKSVLNKEEDFGALALYYFFKENECKRNRDYQEALFNNQQRIKMLALVQDTVHLGAALISQAQSKYRLKDKAGAFAILDELISQEARLSDNVKRQLYGNYGVYLYYRGDFKKALAYYLKGLEFTKRTAAADSKNSRLATAYSNIAEVYLDLKKYDQASIYIDSALQQGFKNIDSRLQESILIYQFRLAAATNQDVKSVIKYINSISDYQKEEYKTKYSKDLDAVKQTNEKALRLLEEKRRAEINNLTLRSRILFLLVILTLLISLVVTGTLFYLRRKYSFEKQNLQMHQRLLRSQMNPHFTFNILYTIQNMIKENQTVAIKYLLKFSRLLRLILENSAYNYVALEKELDSLTKYLDLQLLRFPEKFTYELKLQGLEKDDFIFIPPMLLQPFIENAIEHGFAGINYLGKITLILTLTEENIVCIIEDNGVGITPAAQEKARISSTQLISNFLIKTTKQQVEIQNKKDLDPSDHGTLIKFVIPFKNSEDD
ncbi:MAG: histidine kinase [Saprospiraceae bacterium]